MIKATRNCLLFMIRLNKLLTGRASQWLYSARGAEHCTQTALETSARCSFCYQMSMKRLMDPNSDRWSSCTVSGSTRKRYVSCCVCLSLFPQSTRPENCVDKLHNNKYLKTSLMFALSVYFTVVPPTTSVFAAFPESWWRTSGCSTWLLLNRRPTGCTGLYLPHCIGFFLLSISLHMVATVCQLWPEDSSDLHFTGTELTFCQALSHTHPTHTH